MKCHRENWAATETGSYLAKSSAVYVCVEEKIRFFQLEWILYTLPINDIINRSIQTSETSRGKNGYIIQTKLNKHLDQRVINTARFIYISIYHSRNKVWHGWRM